MLAAASPAERRRKGMGTRRLTATRYPWMNVRRVDTRVVPTAIVIAACIALRHLRANFSRQDAILLPTVATVLFALIDLAPLGFSNLASPGRRQDGELHRRCADACLGFKPGHERPQFGARQRGVVFDFSDLGSCR